MLVYRLEYKGQGVFCSSLRVRYPDDAQYSNFHCQVPSAHDDERYRFGCRTMDKLVAYFGSDFEYLLRQGAEILIYEVPRKCILFSDNGIELAFLIDEAVRINGETDTVSKLPERDGEPDNILETTEGSSEKFNRYYKLSRLPETMEGRFTYTTTTRVATENILARLTAERIAEGWSTRYGGEGYVFREISQPTTKISFHTFRNLDANLLSPFGQTICSRISGEMQRDVGRDTKIQNRLGSAVLV